MKLIAGIFFIALALGVIGLSQALFTVDQREQAILLQLGQPIGDIKGPGLHFKLPFVQDVRKFDRRILSVDPEPKQMVIASSVTPHQKEQKAEDNPLPVGLDAISGEPIVVDTFARFRIVDALKFMKTLRTVSGAQSRLEGIINDATRNTLGRRTLDELLSSERADIMESIRTRVNDKIIEDQLGIDIIDIRIVRADLTPELRQSTVRRMISELHERATETRAKGEERALEIRSTAEKEREVILAEADREAQILRGQGDKEAIAIYAESFNRDKEFYGFMRSMEAYKKTLATPETRLILSPESAFFEHFKGQPSVQ